MIKEAFDLHDVPTLVHLPLHQQALAWGVSKQGQAWCKWPTTYMPFKWISMCPQVRGPAAVKLTQLLVEPLRNEVNTIGSA